MGFTHYNSLHMRRVRCVTLNGYKMAVLLVPLKNGFSSTKS
jgi:hypothetical protein